MKVKIAGLEFSVAMVDLMSEVDHDGKPADLYGQIDYGLQSIKIWRSTPERQLRTLLHEIVHGIVEELSIRELIGPDGKHLENPVNQLASGLSEVLESAGITSLLTFKE